MFKFIKNIINEFRDLLSSLNILVDTKNTKPKIIFFSENKVYQKFSKPLIEIILSVSSNKIYYLSIDKEDKIHHKKVKNYYISPFLINFTFNNLRAENIFLTITDLGNNLLKKTKNIDQYIYYFHSPVSTIKNYTSRAFDNYDTILCVGQFQIDEIRSREKSKNLKKKKLISAGYLYFDYLLNNINYNINNKEILIAPSWNKDLKNFINENFIELIEILIVKGFKVIFRPHPEHFKRSNKILLGMRNKFSNKNFKLDADDNNLKSMEKARCLITDSSGIAIEYMIVMKRPVLYLDEYDKIHNSEFREHLGKKVLDHDIKKNFGYMFKKHDFNKIDFIINDSEKKLVKKMSALNNFIKKNYFYFGNTKTYLFSYFKKNI